MRSSCALDCFVRGKFFLCPDRFFGCEHRSASECFHHRRKDTAERIQGPPRPWILTRQVPFGAQFLKANPHFNEPPSGIKSRVTARLVAFSQENDGRSLRDFGICTNFYSARTLPHLLRRSSLRREPFIGSPHNAIGVCGNGFSRYKGRGSSLTAGALPDESL